MPARLPQFEPSSSSHRRVFLAFILWSPSVFTTLHHTGEPAKSLTVGFEPGTLISEREMAVLLIGPPQDLEDGLKA